MPPLREEMRAEVTRLAELIGAGPQHLPDWDHARGDATPHVELHGRLMYAAALARHPYAIRDYSAAAVRSVAGYLVNTVRGPQDNSAAVECASETAFATCSLIADGLRRNGVDLDEIRRVDRWARRLPAPNPAGSQL